MALNPFLFQVRAEKYLKICQYYISLTDPTILRDGRHGFTKTHVEDRGSFVWI